MERYKLNQEIRKLVWAALVEAHLLPTPAKKLALAADPVKKVVSFIRYFGGSTHEMDKGNFIASCKAYLDALKLDDRGEGLIFDDRPQWCTDLYEQKKDTTRSGYLEIEIT